MIEKAATFTASQVRAELDQLLSSDTFIKKKIQAKFLSHIVELSLAGRSNELHAFNIAIDCFHRDADDEGAESYIRKIASHVRISLNQYYQSAASASVEIHLPSNGYTPQFRPGAANTSQSVDTQPRLDQLAIKTDSLPTRPLPSLAIIPLACGSGSGQDQVIGDIIANQLIDSFSKSRFVRITSSRTTSLFRGSCADPKWVGKKLNSGYLVTGAYQVWNRQTAVDIKMFDTQSGYCIWQNSGRVSIEELCCDTGDSVNRWIEEIGDIVLNHEVTRALQLSTSSLADHCLLVGGMRCTHSQGEQAFSRAKFLLEALDSRLPDSSAPASALSRWYLLALFRGNLGYSSAELAEGVKRQAETAWNREPDNVESRIAMANSLMHVDKNHHAARQHFESAVDQAPNNCIAHAHLASLLNIVGESEQAIKSAYLAVSRSPFDPETYFFYAVAAASLYSAGQIEKSILFCEKSLLINNRHASPMRTLIACYYHLGKKEQAAKIGKQLLTLSPSFSIARYIEEHPFVHSRNGQRVIESLRFARLPER